MIAIAFLYGCWFFGFGYVRQVVGDRELAKGHYPIPLPMRLLAGQYMPSEGQEALTFATSKVRESTLNPDLTKIVDAQVVMLGDAEYRVSGEIEALNDYGTPVRADFSLQLRKPVSKSHSSSRTATRAWSRTVINRRPGFAMVNCDLGRTGQGTVWRANPSRPSAQYQPGGAYIPVYQRGKNTSGPFNPPARSRNWLGQGY